jgi:hypothetical protein
MSPNASIMSLWACENGLSPVIFSLVASQEQVTEEACVVAPVPGEARAGKNTAREELDSMLEVKQGHTPVFGPVTATTWIPSGTLKSSAVGHSASSSCAEPSPAFRSSLNTFEEYLESVRVEPQLVVTSRSLSDKLPDPSSA